MQTVLKTDKEFQEFKTFTLGLLHDNSAKDLCVTFTKKDGSERKMFCTLAESRIPAEKQPKSQASDSEVVKNGDGSAVRVFDTEKSEWRSFRWDSVTKLEYTL
jgi:hypothetical protein